MTTHLSLTPTLLSHSLTHAHTHTHTHTHTHPTTYQPTTLRPTNPPHYHLPTHHTTNIPYHTTAPPPYQPSALPPHLPTSPYQTNTLPHDNIDNRTSRENIQQCLLLLGFIWFQSTNLTHRFMIKHPDNHNSLHRIVCFISSLLHLFDCFRIIISRTSLRSSVTSLTSATTSSLILSRILCHMSMRSLTCIITCIIISRNTITTRTSLDHPLFTLSHAMISTLPQPSPPKPPISTFHDPFFSMPRSVPSPLLIHTSAFQHQNQHARFRSLASHDPFLDIQEPDSTCHGPFVSMLVYGP